MYKPKTKDGTPMWQIIFDMFADKEPDIILTYDEITNELNKHTDEPTSIEELRSAVYGARPHLIAERKKWLGCVRGLGYRIIPAREHIGVSTDYRERATRSVNTAVAVAVNTDMQGMTPSERNHHSAVRQGLCLLAQRMADHDETLERHEAAINELNRRIGVKKPKSKEMPATATVSSDKS